MADPRRTYQEVGLATASPERLLCLLWDRLLRDLAEAEQALRAGDLYGASTGLLHAQDIVFELRATLRVDAWQGGPALDALYAYVGERLVQANVHKDPAVVAECTSLLTPLRDAFHEAAAREGAARAALAETA